MYIVAKGGSYEWTRPRISKKGKVYVMQSGAWDGAKIITLGFRIILEK